jgi:hypothetical protein
MTDSRDDDPAPVPGIRPVTGDTLAGAPRDREELASSPQVGGGSRFEEALVLANRLHWAQTRKASPIPYTLAPAEAGYIDHLRTAPEGVLRVSAADKPP